LRDLDRRHHRRPGVGIDALATWLEGEREISIWEPLRADRK